MDIDWDALPWGEHRAPGADGYIAFMASWWGPKPGTAEERAKFAAAVEWQRAAWDFIAPGAEVVTRGS